MNKFVITQTSYVQYFICGVPLCTWTLKFIVITIGYSGGGSCVECVTASYCAGNGAFENVEMCIRDSATVGGS